MYKIISPPCSFDDFPMVSTFIDEERRRWKANVIRSLFLPFEVDIILNIPLSYNLPEDKLIWVGNSRSEFTMKRAYYIALKMVESAEDGECLIGDARTPLWKKMWHLKIPPKIIIFAWRACINALPTMINLRKKGVNTSGYCPLCGQEIETIIHSIIMCD